MPVTDTVNDEPILMTHPDQPLQNAVATGDFSRIHIFADGEDQTVAQIGCNALRLTPRRRILLEDPVRQMKQPPSRGFARICPAEPRVQRIFHGIPRGLAGGPRWVRIEGPDLAVEAHDPPGHQQVHLEPPGMRMGRDEHRRTTSGRNASKPDLDPEPQRQIHRPSQAAVPAIEQRNIDILGRKGQYAGAIFVKARRCSYGRAGQPGIAQ